MNTNGMNTDAISTQIESAAQNLETSALTGVHAMRAVRDHAGMPEWAGPLAWAALEAHGADLSRCLAYSVAGLGLLQGLPSGQRPQALSDDAATSELLGRLGSRAAAINSTLEELWLSRGTEGARWSAAVAWTGAGPALTEYPELDGPDAQVLDLIRLMGPDGLLSAWVPCGHQPSEAAQALIGARGQLRAVIRVAGRDLWLISARSARDSALLSTDPVLAQQFSGNWYAQAAQSSLSGGDLRALMGQLIEACAHSRPVDDGLSRRLMQALPASARSRLQARASRPQPWSLQRRQELQMFQGRWMTVTAEEVRTLQAMRALHPLIEAALNNESERSVAEQRWAKLSGAQPALSAQLLRRMRPEGLHHLLAVVSDQGELQWPQQEADQSTPLERLTALMNGAPITGADGAQVGLDSRALEAALLADGRAFTASGWILPEVYRNAYATDLLEQLPTPTTPEQLAAVQSQQAQLEELLEQARADVYELTPFESYISQDVVTEYVNHLLVENFPTLRFESNLASVKRVHGEYVLDWDSKATRSEKRRKATRMIERYITRQNRMVLEERVYARFNRNFRAWAEDQGHLDQIEAGRLTTVWAGGEWPVRPISRSLPGWKRSRTPRPWQERSALRTRVQKRGIIGFRTGVGKTLAGTMHALDMVREGHRAVIVVPSSVLPQWRQEIEMCTRLPLAVIGSRQTSAGQWEDVQNGAEIDYQLQQAIADKRQLVLISYGAFERLRPQISSLRELLSLSGLPVIAETWDEMQNRPRNQAGMLLARERHISHADWDLYCEIAVHDLIAREDARTPNGQAINADNVEGELQMTRVLIDAIMDQEPEDRDQVRLERLRVAREYLTFILRGIKLGLSHLYTLQTSWEALGVSALIIDEVHNFKGHNVPAGGGVRYLGTTAVAGRSVDMRHKARMIQFGVATRPGGSTIGLSATPYKNSVIDIYNLLDMLAPELWARMGLKTPGQFMERYCQIKSVFEVPRRQRMSGKKAEKGDAKPVRILERFRNVRELRQITMPYIDIVRPQDVGLKVPDSTPRYKVYPATKAAADVIKTVATEPDVALARWGGKMDLMDIEDPKARLTEALLNNQGLMRITQRAELDLEMIDPVRWVGDVSPKVAGLLEEVAELVSSGVKTLIFCDTVNMFDPANADKPNPRGYSFHDKLKRLICERTGLSPEQVGIINGQATPLPEDRHAVAERLNDGRMALVIGNGDVMGESLNLQEEVGAIQNLDLPPNPAGIEQRQGRVIRQGNELERVQETYHMGSRGQDTYMMDLMRGKRGLYDQLWMGTDDIVDNPERAMIPTADQLELLSIDDDQERARRAAELLAREELRMRLERRRSWRTLIYQVQEWAEYKRYAQKQLDQASDIARKRYDQELAEIARKEADDEAAGKPKRARKPKTNLTPSLAGPVAARLKRLERNAQSAITQLRIEGFKDLDNLDENSDLRIYAPMHNAMLEVGSLVLFPAEVVNMARNIEFDEQDSGEIDEEDPEALMARLAERSVINREVQTTRQQLGQWMIGRIESIGQINAEVSLISAPVAGKVLTETVDIYDLTTFSHMPPNLAARLILCERAGINPSEEILVDLDLSAAAVAHASELIARCEDSEFELIVRTAKGLKLVPGRDEDEQLPEGIVTGPVSEQDWREAVRLGIQQRRQLITVA